jgi:hypothetical protein
MKNEFIPYEQALALKWLGFNESCLGYYDIEGLKVSYDRYLNSENKNSLFEHPSITNNPKISAPLYQQAFRWFREKHVFYIHSAANDLFYFMYSYDPMHLYYKAGPLISKIFETYEETEFELLKKLIELSTQTK